MDKNKPKSLIDNEIRKCTIIQLSNLNIGTTANRFSNFSYGPSAYKL